MGLFGMRLMGNSCVYLCGTPSYRGGWFQITTVLLLWATTCRNVFILTAYRWQKAGQIALAEVVLWMDVLQPVTNPTLKCQ